MSKFVTSILLATAGLFMFLSCTEKESDLGIDLQDPSTIYNGIRDTAYGTAFTVYDDSLLTSNLSQGLVGCYSDDVFGSAEAILFTQVNTANGEGVEFDQYCRIDSVVLSIAISELYTSGSSKGLKDLHFEIYRLDGEIMKDSVYYAFDQVAVGGECYFDGVVRMLEGDTMVANIKLNDNIISLFNNKVYANGDEFANTLKGLRIRLLNDGNPVMASVNLAAAATRMSVYYAYTGGEDIINRTYDFIIGNTAPHFMQFKRNYTGVLSSFNTNHSDSLDGSSYLYLSPMGGTNINFNIDAFVRQFHQDHPFAVIHYAELILPVADLAPDQKPDLIAALKCYSDGSAVNIPDMYDAYTYNGYDGKYNAETNCYRLRITQHMQKLLGSGMDLGTLLVLNGRRSSVAHTIINGCSAAATSDNPIRIEFVYSE